MAKPSHPLALLGAALLATLATGAAQAQNADKVTIGFVTDMSSVYSDGDGKGGLAAIQMAIDEVGGKVLGKPIQLLSADHQNKADIAASRAREWFDTQNMQMLVGGTNSSAGLAMGKIADEKKRVYMITGSGTSAFTNELCSPYFIHYTYDTVAHAKASGKAITEAGGKDWFFLTADYAFGHALEADTSKVVKAQGGRVLGSVRHPLNASDFSSFLLQAQNSKAKVLALANAGGDTINAIKAAREFGIDKSMQITALLIFSSDIQTLGLKQTQGLIYADNWHWERSPESKKFAEDFYAKTGKMPTSIQASDYSAVKNYLRIVQKLGTTDADKVMAEFKSIELNDMYGKGRVRPDGRYAHDMYLLQVKSPAESKGKFDYFKVLKTLPGEEVFTTKEESRCKLWK